jgi:Family of unknown function (DUF5675)
MKRIDDLVGATVTKIEVGRGGKVRLRLNDARGYSCEWSPLLLEVPNFTGIRIHSGNSDHDTEGCILVGESRAPDWVGASRKAFELLFPLIEAAQPDLWITITDEPLQDSRTEGKTA